MQLRHPPEAPTGFVMLPVEPFSMPLVRIDWERTEELYRDAFEQARTVVRPSVVNRLGPFWN